MEAEMVLSLSIFAAAMLAVLATALNLGVQARVILEKPKSRPGLRKRILTTGSFCSVLGVLFMVLAVLANRGIFSCAFCPPWNFWATISIAFLLSVGVPLVVQGLRLGKTRSDLKDFARELRTLANWLKYVAIAAAVVLVIVIPLAFWLIGLLT